MKLNSVSIRSDPILKNLLKEIKIARIKNGKNNSLLSDRRLTKAIARIPNIREILTESEIKDE